MIAAKHAIVTGGSSGIGKETARLLARHGANVTIIARRRDVLHRARDEIASDGLRLDQRLLALQADVADRHSIEAAIDKAQEEVGPCDLLVTSAGIAHPAHFEDLSIDIFERTAAVNYLGTVYSVRAVIPEMRKLGHGHIVMISSGLGIVGVFGYSAYSPTKFALRGLAESLRGEFRRFGISVSIAYPPDTDTPQLAAENATKPAETRAILSGSRTWQPEAVARSIVAGIERGRFAITPGWEMTWLYRLHSVLQPALHWHFDRIAKRVRRRQVK